MQTPPFPDKEDVLKLFTINDIYIMCALPALLILVGILCHDMPSQYTKSKAVALVLMQVVMISPCILWDRMVSPHIHEITGMHSVLMSGYCSWIRYLWCWHEFGFPFQFMIADTGVVYFLMCKKCEFEMPSEKSLYSCLAPFFEKFIEYLDNDMRKSMADHLVAKTPVFFLMIFFRLCENAVYDHTIPVICTIVLLYLAYDSARVMIRKKFAPKSKSKKN